MNGRGYGTRTKRLVSLLALAASQAGYVTCAQARGLGYSRRALHYRYRQGLLTRVARGVYRVSFMPEPPFGDVVLARLVTDPERAVASHWTALELHELVATRSQQVHLTVPASRRPRPRAALPWVKVHTAADFPSVQVTSRSGIPVVLPARAIADVAAEGDLGAVYWGTQEALRRGLATVDDIVRALRERRVPIGIRAEAERMLLGMIGRSGAA